MITENLSTLKIHKLTQTQYERELEAGTLDENALYLTPDIESVPTSRTINGKALSSDISLSASDVGADASGSAANALTSATAYTNAQINAMVGDETVANQISSAIASIDYPVTSVNGKIGAVTLSALDVGAASALVRNQASIKATGWYKIGTLKPTSYSGIATIYIGGSYYYSEPPTAIVDVVVAYNKASINTRISAGNLSSQVTKVGIIAESATSYSIYAYYGSSSENTVVIHVDTVDATFTPIAFTLTSINESSMTDVTYFEDYYNDSVESVNGKSGKVTLAASDVGALGNSGTQTMADGSLILDDTSNSGWYFQTRRHGSDGNVHKSVLSANSNGTVLYYYLNDSYSNGMILSPSATSFSKPVAIGSGGTGATTAADALANIGAAPALAYHDASLKAQGWYKIGTLKPKSYTGTATIHIGGSYSNSRPPSSIVDVAIAYNSVSVKTRITAGSTSDHVNKVGIIADSVNTYSIYVYYGTSSANAVVIHVDTVDATFTPIAFTLTSINESSMTDVTYLEEYWNYGTTLPTAGCKGRIFFKKV